MVILLVVILLVVILNYIKSIDGYCIINYCWLFSVYYNYGWPIYYKLFLDIVNYIIIGYW
jgi:hypothetical protein